MNKFLMILTLAVAAPLAFANELDQDVSNQQRMAKDLPRTLVVRVNDKTGEVAVLHSEKVLAQEAKLNLDDAKFVSVNSQGMRSELDRDSSTSGWYFYWYNYSYYSNYYYYPAYYYGGYNYYYRPYYNYYWNNCNYYWYRWY